MTALLLEATRLAVQAEKAALAQTQAAETSQAILEQVQEIAREQVPEILPAEVVLQAEAHLQEAPAHRILAAVRQARAAALVQVRHRQEILLAQEAAQAEQAETLVRHQAAEAVQNLKT